jgi:hypothetical protein
MTTPITYNVAYDQHLHLKEALKNLNLAKRNLEEAMIDLSIDTVNIIFENNPVFYDGASKDSNENMATYSTDRYIMCQDMLSKAYCRTIAAQETLLRIGIHHVRLQAGENVS